jgi:lysophospholipid acyltransferase (LPLAT)-like uncharacterized protein
VKIRNRHVTKFAGWLIAAIFRLLSRTLRLRGFPEAEYTDCSVAARRGYIYALWHDSILIPLARQALKRPHVAALVSRHQDGAYLANSCTVSASARSAGPLPEGATRHCAS